MDQVSRPVLIALIATAALAGVWFVALRPKSDSGSAAPTATAPGQAGLERSIDKAKGAVATSQASADASEKAAQAASGDAPAATAAPTAPAPAATPAKAAKPATPKLADGDRSGPIVRELANGKVAVVTFFNPRGADDHAALRAVRSADRHGGRVAFHSIPISKVGAYNALTTGVEVLQAPTVVVIGPDRKARTIVGYTEVKEVDQLVDDVGGFAKPKHRLTGFAAAWNKVCGRTGQELPPAGAQSDRYESALAGLLARTRADRHTLALVPATGQKPLKRAMFASLDASIAAFAKAKARVAAGDPVASVSAQLVPAVTAATKTPQRELKRAHVSACL